MIIYYFRRVVFENRQEGLNLWPKPFTKGEGFGRTTTQNGEKDTGKRVTRFLSVLVYARGG